MHPLMLMGSVFGAAIIGLIGGWFAAKAFYDLNERDREDVQ